MHLRNKQKDPGCLLLSRSYYYYNCPPKKGLCEAIHSPDFLKSPGTSERPNPSEPELDSYRIVDIISMLKVVFAMIL